MINLNSYFGASGNVDKAITDWNFCCDQESRKKILTVESCIVDTWYDMAGEIREYDRYSTSQKRENLKG